MNTTDITTIFLENMKPYIPLLIFIVIIGTILKELTKKKRKSKTGDYKYQKKTLMSVNEKSFYSELLPICKKHGFLLFSKVRLIDLIEPVRGGNSNVAKLHIIQKHVDFVLCHASTLTPMLVIELDDNSHNSASAQQRDADKNKALESAGLPIIRTRTAARLEESIMKALGIDTPTRLPVYK